MSTSPRSEPEQTGDARQPVPAERLSEDLPTPDRALLETVLRQTLASCTSDDPTDTADMEAVEQVARRRRGQPFALDPVVVELVEAMLQAEFHVKPNASEVWSGMSLQLAQTLFEDPLSRHRLKTLWARLSEGTS